VPNPPERHPAALLGGILGQQQAERPPKEAPIEPGGLTISGHSPVSLDHLVDAGEEWFR